MIKFIIIINVYLYLLSPVACLAHDLEIHDNASSTTSSHFLTIDAIEGADSDSDGEQDCDLQSRRILVLACHHGASDNYLAVSKVSIPIIVPPEFLA